MLYVHPVTNEVVSGSKGMRKRSFEEIAVHEAGHAFAVLAGGTTDAMVRLSLSENQRVYNGVVEHDRQVNVTDFSHAITILAGPVAQALDGLPDANSETICKRMETYRRNGYFLGDYNQLRNELGLKLSDCNRLMPSAFEIVRGGWLHVERIKAKLLAQYADGIKLVSVRVVRDKKNFLRVLAR